ncbi:MAG: BNR-4 repeat-containing protein, partial [Planctomycetaceae bacterium]|nr:BNR-4 repeat-containing protein [Planctomycetaceae bacterium]
ILLDKHTDDAHDNPVISLDAAGYIWIFSTSHGTSRPSWIHRSARPWDISEFELIPARYSDGDQQHPITNFSYMQVWQTRPAGFQAFFTRYGAPAKRTLFYMRSADGVAWEGWQRLAAIEEGHYQVSGSGRTRTGTMFNYHPNGKGLNWRTNLYYMETANRGETWTNVNGESLALPIVQVSNPALVHDYQSAGLNVYLKDLQYDDHDHPVLLYVTSRGYQSGPENNPRTWTIARWDGHAWQIHEIGTSDNNYDTGELHLLAPDDWRLIGPTITGPQPFNPGGEMSMWQSIDRGGSWKQIRQLTQSSSMNHNYARRVLNARPEFIALWADGHGRQPSESRLYFVDERGDVYRLPVQMDAETALPERVEAVRP